MKKRSILVSILLVLLMAAPAHAGANITLGCARAGYTMTLPGYVTWQVEGNCSARTFATLTGGVFIIGVKLEPHSYWNDARSRASITQDAINSRGTGTQQGTTVLHTETINGTHYVVGLAMITRGGTPLIGVEMETFRAGRMFKFVASYENASNAQADAGAALLGSIWRTIRIAP